MIENHFDKTQNFQFLNLTRELEPPGTLAENAQYDFDFKNVEMQYESYQGICVSLKYFIRITVNRAYGAAKHEEVFLVYNTQEPDETSHTIKLEVGIEECLHIQFEYQKSRYHLKDCVLGKVDFNLVRIKLKHMELAL